MGIFNSAITGFGIFGTLIFFLWVFFVNFTEAGRVFFFNKHLLIIRQISKSLVDCILSLSRYISYKLAIVIAIVFALIINTVIIKVFGLTPNIPFYPEGVAGKGFFVMLLGSAFGVILLWAQLGLINCFLELRFKQKNEVVEALECITYPVSSINKIWFRAIVFCVVILVVNIGGLLLNGLPENIAFVYKSVIKELFISIIDILLIIRNLISVFILLSFVSLFMKKMDYVVIVNEWSSTLGNAIFPIKLRILMLDFTPVLAIPVCGIIHFALMSIIQ